MKLLRTEANKLNAFWEKQSDAWVKERATLVEEISALRETRESVEEYYQEATDARNQETECLKDHIQLLAQKEDYYIKLAQDKVQTDKQLRELRDREQKFTEQTSTELLSEAREEAQKAYDAEVASKRVNDSYVKDLAQKNHEKFEAMKEREGAITFENEQLRKQLNEARKTYADLESTVKQEVMVMRNQVRVMGNLTNEKLDEADTDRKQFEAELKVAAKHADAI